MSILLLVNGPPSLSLVIQSFFNRAFFQSFVVLMNHLALSMLFFILSYPMIPLTTISPVIYPYPSQPLIDRSLSNLSPVIAIIRLF